MASPPVRLSVTLPSFGPYLEGDWRQLCDLARMAEDAGVDELTVPDHVVMGPNTDAYRWGRFPYPPDAPWMEPLTAITAMATVTERVRFMTGILIAPLRNPALLAKTAATVDVLSGGRLDLGVGIGWQREEFAAAGVAFEGRGARMDDLLGACRALWTDSPASYSSPTVSFEEIWCEPKPVRPGGVPLWFSGTLTDRTLDRMTRLGDGFIPIMGRTLDGVREDGERIREAWSAAGRDPDLLEVAATLPLEKSADGGFDLGVTLDGLDALADAGVTLAQTNLAVFARSLGDAPAFFADLGRRLATRR